MSMRDGKPILPFIGVRTYARLLRREIVLPILVQGAYPMDVANVVMDDIPGVIWEEGWVTSKGVLLTQKQAADLAFENDLVDRRHDLLTVTEYQGQWKL